LEFLSWFSAALSWFKNFLSWFLKKYARIFKKQGVFARFHPHSLEALNDAIVARG